jgi:hypothetical protein
MNRHEYAGVDTSVIVQQVGGDLRVRAHEDDVLLVDGERVHVEHLGAGQPYLVRAAGDARLIVPDTVPLVVQAVGGDAKITDVEAAVEVVRVGGDLSVRNAASARVGLVGGDARIKRVSGDVRVEGVGGDATIRDIDGSLWVSQVGADLYVRNVLGDCVVERTGADLVLSLEFAPDREYRFSAGADILCRVHPDSNVTFELPPQTTVQLDIPADMVETDEQHRIVLGDGSARVIISRADRLRLVGEDDDYMVDFSVQIEDELEARLSSLEEKLTQHLEGLDERIQATTVRLSSQAERMAERAQREAMRAAEQLRRSIGRWEDKPKRGKAKRGRFAVGMMEGRPTPPPPPREPVTEQERLMILKMVQEGKITIEEAEKLLSALES